MQLYLIAIDIASAFLYPDYVGPKLIAKRPSGLADTHIPEYMELGKCIYKLKQVARMVRQHLDATLKPIGFIPTHADTCVEREIFVVVKIGFKNYNAKSSTQ